MLVALAIPICLTGLVMLRLPSLMGRVMHDVLHLRVVRLAQTLEKTPWSRGIDEAKRIKDGGKETRRAESEDGCIYGDRKQFKII